jgi:hypothetical protein
MRNKILLVAALLTAAYATVLLSYPFDKLAPASSKGQTNPYNSEAGNSNTSPYK